MATKIYNQATLNYNSGNTPLSSTSNIASVNLQGLLDITKYSLEDSYRIGDTITYILFIANSTDENLTGLTVIDHLGTYQIGEDSITPLTYISPSKTFESEVYSNTIVGEVSAEKDFVTFDIGTLSSGSTLILIYKAFVNEYAGAIIGESTITNTAQVTADTFAAPVDASTTIPVAAYANLTISKSISPSPLIDNGPVIYTLSLTNTGNLDATNVIITDEFTTVPTIDTVLVDETEPQEHSFENGIFQFPKNNSTYEYTIPKANFIRDPETHMVTIEPQISTVVISGTI